MEKNLVMKWQELKEWAKGMGARFEAKKAW